MSSYAVFDKTLSNIAFNFNVGIGTTLAVTPLHVQGNQYISGNLGVGITTPIAPFHLNAIGYVSPSGAVGIGSTQPISPLDVNVTSASNAVRIRQEGAADALHVSTIASANALRVMNDGKVGVGTATALTTFHVQGTHYTSGNVGVGTNTPAERIHVYDATAEATMMVQSGTGVTRSEVYLSANTNDKSALAYYNKPLYIGRTTDGSVTTTQSTMVFTTTDNIGIGTTDPQDKFHVQGNIRASGTVTASNLTIIGDFVTLNTVTSNTEQMVVTNAGTGPALKVTQTGANTVAEFYDAEVTDPALFIANGGYIGVGTTNPSYKFDLWESSAGASVLMGGDFINIGRNRTGNGASYFALHSGPAANNEKLEINRDINGYSSITHFGTNPFTISCTNASKMLLKSNNQNGVAIDTTGYVGIGTTTPVSLMHIYGSSTTGGTTITENVITVGFARTANGNSSMRLVSDSNVYTNGGLVLTRASGANGDTVMTHRGTGGFYLTAVEAAPIYLQTNGATPFAITSGGTIGIGTLIPLAKMHVHNNSGYNTYLMSAPATGSGTMYTQNIQYSETAGGAVYYKCISGWSYTGNFGHHIDIEGTFTRVDMPSRKFKVGFANSYQTFNALGHIEGSPGSYTVPCNIQAWKNTTNSTYDIYIIIDSFAYANFTVRNTEVTGVLPAVTNSGAPSATASYTKIYDLLENSTLTTLGTTTANSSGSVGIGVTNPSNKLSVGSSSAILTSQMQISHPSGDWGLVMKRTANDGGHANIAFLKSRGETATQIVQGDSIGRVAFWAVTSNIGTTQWLGEIGLVNEVMTSASNADGAIYFNTKQTTDASPVERVRITPNGNVGIGTTNPAAKLHVSGSYGSISIQATGTSGRDYRINSTAVGNASTGCLEFYDQAAASARLVIDSSGNVGIGKTNPQEKLDINGNLRLSPNATTDTRYIKVGTGRTGNGYSQIDLIGDATYSDFGMRIIRNDGGANANSAIGHRGTGNLEMYCNEAAAFVVVTNSTERMRVTGDGNVGIGIASPNRRFHISGPSSASMGTLCVDQTASSGFTDTVMLSRSSQASANSYSHLLCQAGGGSINVMQIRGDGNCYNTYNAYGAFSDSNLKENIQDAREYLNDLMSLRVVKFSLKNENSPVPTQLGLIAQEVQEVFPSLVDMDASSSNLMLKYSVINMMTLKAVQELNQKSTQQLELINTLTSSNQMLMNRIATIEAHLNL